MSARTIKPKFKQSEVGIIPEEWRVVDYDSFGQVIDGDRGNHYPSAGELRADGYCVFLSATNVTKTGFRFDDCQFISVEKDNELNKGKLIRNDVVLTTRGTVGNFAFYDSDVQYDNMRINSGMVLLRNVSPNVSNIYQYAVLKSQVVGSQIERCAFGSAQSQLTVKGIASLKIPLPPTMAEQEAIAESLGSADAFVAGLEQILTKKRNLRQGSIQELLTGRRRLAAYGARWAPVRLGDVAAFYKGKGLPKSSINAFDPMPCVHYGELFTQYSEIITETISRTNYFKGCFKSSKNDVVMPTSDVTPYGLAKASCISSDGIILGGDILVIRPIQEQLFGPFLSYVIRFHEEQILKLVTGSTVFHLYAGDMKRFAFLFPSVTEQRDIVSILSEMDAEIAALEEKLAKARKIKRGMMQQLLTGQVRLI